MFSERRYSMGAQTAEKLIQKTDDILIENLHLLMHKQRINEAELARRTGIPQPTLHKILSGKTTDPRISTLQQLAGYFEVSLDGLYAYDVLQNKKNIAEGKSVPIISWSDCTKPDNPTQGLTLNNWSDWVIVDQNSGDHSYALVSRACMEPYFPRGTKLIIDPTIKPTDGDLVIVQYPETEDATLRELSIDGPTQLLLTPYKKSEPEPLIQGMRILGTVTQSRFSY